MCAAPPGKVECIGHPRKRPRTPSLFLMDSKKRPSQQQIDG